MFPQLSQCQRQLAWGGVVFGAKLLPALSRRDQPLLREEAQAESSLNREASTELPQGPMVLVDIGPCPFRVCTQPDEAVDVLSLYAAVMGPFWSYAVLQLIRSLRASYFFIRK